MRIKLLAALATVPAVALVAWACGGPEFVAGSQDASTVSADQACGDNAVARCQRLQQCSAEQMISIYGTLGACETRIKLNCLNGNSAPNSGASPEATEACAQTYATESCDDLLDDRPTPPCVQVAGSEAVGEPCAFAGQCQSAYCQITPGSPCGACAPPPDAGASCASLTTCGQTLACVDGVCSGFAPQGGTCTKTALCGAGLVCIGSTSTGPGTCEPAVEDAGAACDPTAITGPGCDREQSLTCNGVSKTCVPLTFAAAGQACGTVNHQSVACSGAGVCTAVGATAGAVGREDGVDALLDGGVGGLLDGAIGPFQDGGVISTSDGGVISTSDGGTLGVPDAGADAASSPTEVCVAVAADLAPCNVVTGPSCLNPARCMSFDGGSGGTCQFPNALFCPSTQ